MKTRIFKIILIAVLLINSSCSESSIHLNKEFTVKQNEEVIIKNNGDDLKIRFDSLEDYSVCPEDVNCIWAGKVDITLKINDSKSYKMGLLGSDYAEKITFEKYEITLLNVTPLLTSGEITNFVATFIVKEI